MNMMTHPYLQVSIFQPYKMNPILILGSLFELLQNCFLRNWKSMLCWSIQIKSHVICAQFGDQCQGKNHQKLKFRFAGMFLLILIDRAP